MKNLQLIILMSLFVFSSVLYSQNVSKGDNAEKKYTQYFIKPKYPVNVAFSYKKSTETKVTQFFSDSSNRSFKRNVDLFFTFYSPQKAESGITELRVTIDSLAYKFSNGLDSVFYDSQNDELAPPFKYEDYEATSVVLGKSFNFFYSPYWDFGKIEGTELAVKRNFVNNPLDGITDTMRNYFWNYRLSDVNLTEIVDVLKNMISTSSIDTSMNRKIKFGLEAEEISFADTNAIVKLTNASSQSHILKAVMNNLRTNKKSVRIFGFGKFVDVIKSDGKGEYELEISPQGRVDGAKGNFKINLLLQDRKETIKEVIEQNITYQLLMNYKI